MKSSFAGWTGHQPTRSCLLLISALLVAGCQSAPGPQGRSVVDRAPVTGSLRANSDEPAGAGPPDQILLTGYPSDLESDSVETTVAASVIADDDAPATPLRLRSLLQKANAASMRTKYVDRLPDPTFGANVFGHPIETAAGSQRANLTLMQMIPWLDRLEAQQQQACFEAMALRQQYAAERLRVIAEVRAGYYKLYVLRRQIETVEANQQLLETLTEIVTARTESTGRAADHTAPASPVHGSRYQPAGQSTVRYARCCTRSAAGSGPELVARNAGSDGVEAAAGDRGRSAAGQCDSLGC